MKNNHRFIEYMSFAIVFVLLVFCGFAIFYSPQNKMEYRFNKMNISDKFTTQDEYKINGIEENFDKINDEINIPNNKYKYYGSEYAKSIKRKKINDILASRKFSVNKKKFNNDIVKTGINERNIENIENQKLFYNDSSIDNPKLNISDVSRNIPPQYMQYSINSTCSEDEMEYILVLYDNFLKKNFSLVFRRPSIIRNAKPHVISVTLPHNTWKDAGNNLTNTMSLLFNALVGDSEESQSDRTKINAIITTPCSSSLYSSNSFYIDNKLPVQTNSANSNICNSKGGRLPDVLELISMIKDNSTLPFGYYVSSSEIIINGKISQNKLIISYSNDNMNFITSAQIKGNRKFYYKCVFD